MIWLAGQHDLQDAVVEALFRGYFTEGRDVGSLQILVDVAAEAGLDRHIAEEMLSSDDGMQAITTGLAHETGSEEAMSLKPILQVLLED